MKITHLYQPNKFQSNGFAALFIVVIIGAVALIMAKAAILISLGELEMGQTSQRGGEAFSVADGCTEETLRRIRLDTNYGIGAGTINLTVINGSCIIVVTDLGSNQRRIVVTGQSSNYYKKIETNISLNSNIISITSWKERDD